MGYQDYINRAVGGSRRGGAEMANYLNELALAQGERGRDAAMAGGLTTFGGPTPANPYIDKLMQAKLAASDREAGLGMQGAGIEAQVLTAREKTAAQKALQEAMLKHQTSERTGAQQWKSDESVEDRIFRGSQQSNLFGHQAEQGRLGREAQLGLANISAATTRRGQDLSAGSAGASLALQQSRDNRQWQQNLMQTALANPKIATQNPYFNQMWKGAGGKVNYGMGGGRPVF